MERLEKLKILNLSLKGIECDEYIYICNAIFHTSLIEAVKLFPELLEYMPEGKRLNRAWWDNDEKGKEARIIVLKQLIKRIEDGK